MNWDDLRYVLALAEAGSLARAARKLKVDHTTVGRRIEALEADVGIQLFTRTTNGYTLTREGEEFLPDIRQIEANALAIERSAQARSQGITGTYGSPPAKHSEAATSRPGWPGSHGNTPRFRSTW